MKRINIFILCILMLFLSSCTEKEVSVEDEKLNYLLAETGEISIPLTPFESLDPLTTENMSYFYMSSLIFEGLFTLDDNLRPQTLLASSYNLDDNKMTISIKDGITFHDGSALTVKDVLYSLDHLRNSMKGPYYNLVVNNISREFPLTGKIIDNTTIEISYNGVGPFLKEYLIFPIVKEGTLNSKIPLGTGPYMVDTYENKKEIILTAYENYHDEMPSISRIRGVYHDDKDLIYTSLETGRIHVSTSWGQNFYRFFNNEHFNAQTYPSNEMYFLFLNPEGELAKANYREAIKSSIDKERIIKIALDDQGIKTTGFINPNSYFCRVGQDLTNIDKAKELLSGDKPTLKFYFYWKNEYQLKIATLIAESLYNLGIKVEFVGNSDEDFNTYLENLKAGGYDIALSSMAVNIIPDYSYNLNSGIFPYQSETISKLNEDIKSTHNESDLILVTNSIDETINRENIFIPLVYKMNALIYSNAIVGDIKPNIIFPYKSLSTAYFTTKENETIDEDAN